MESNQNQIFNVNLFLQKIDGANGAEKCLKILLDELKLLANNLNSNNLPLGYLDALVYAKSKSIDPLIAHEKPYDWRCSMPHNSQYIIKQLIDINLDYDKRKCNINWKQDSVYDEPHELLRMFMYFVMDPELGGPDYDNKEFNDNIKIKINFNKQKKVELENPERQPQGNSTGKAVLSFFSGLFSNFMGNQDKSQKGEPQESKSQYKPPTL